VSTSFTTPQGVLKYINPELIVKRQMNYEVVFQVVLMLIQLAMPLHFCQFRRIQVTEIEPFMKRVRIASA
jgi:hypothetical protein